MGGIIERNMKKICKDVFIWYLLTYMAILLLIKEFFQGDINFIPRYILLLILVIISIIYFILSKLNPLDRKDDRDKVPLLIRHLFFRLEIIILLAWLKILFTSFSFEISNDFIELIVLLLAYQLVFSLLAIMFGIKFRTLFFIMITIFPIMIVLGVFDIKWWALVTGFLTLWNYLNSEDFLYYLRRGRKLPEIPKELRYRWSTNKLIAYLMTFLFYISLVISSFLEEKQPQTLLEYLSNAEKRVYSMLGVTVFLMLIGYTLSYYFYLLNSNKKIGKVGIWILSIGSKCGLNNFNTGIQVYIKAKKGELK